MTAAHKPTCDRIELAALYALGVLPRDEAAEVAAHLADCADCRGEFEQARSTADKLVAWPTDLLKPRADLEERLADRIAAETKGERTALPPRDYREPDWEEVAPGIFCKILATDPERDRVTMLVRLLPGVSYPPHTHAGVEELHLLDGELWINDRLLFPGDYNYGEAGDFDKRVYSETGCTCVLVTSPSDVLR